MLCYFLQNSEVNQLYIYVYPLLMTAQFKIGICIPHLPPTCLVYSFFFPWLYFSPATLNHLAYHSTNCLSFLNQLY